MAFSPLFIGLSASASEPTVINTQGGDDNSYQIPINSPVMFMGQEYSSIYATTNAVITFGRPDGTYWDFPMTPSISLGSTDWVVFPWARPDEHFIITYTDNAFQVDMAARPIWLQGTPERSRLILTGIINQDRTISFSYYLENTDPYQGLRFGVRTPSGQVQSLEDAGFYESQEPPAEEGQIMEPTPTPEPTPDVTPPFIPEGAAVHSEGSVVQIIAPAGQRISSAVGYYGDPADSSRGLEVSGILAELLQGKVSETLEVSNNAFGIDPAPGTVKILIILVSYENIPVEPTPIEPSPEPTPEPTQTEQPVLPEPTPTVSLEPSPEPSPSTSVAPSPEPSQEPEPSPSPLPTVEPSPTQSATPVPTPSVEPTPEVTAPSPQPSPAPTETQTPEPEPTIIPQPTPSPTPSEPEFIIPSDAEELIEELLTVDPSIVSLDQLEEIKEMVYEVFDSVEPGSEEYQQALEALAVLAQVDDAELPEELAAIPLIGDVAGAVLDTFNALGNVGADMSPEVREQSEDVIVAAVIVGQVAITATTAAASAAAVASRRI